MIAFRRALALVIVSAACRPASEPLRANPTKPAAAPVVVATVSAVPSASASPPAVGVEPAASGTEQELDAIVTAMCAASHREENGKRSVGCRRPPPFKGRGRESDGKMSRFQGDDPTTFCGVAIAARGSFSAPDRKETLVTIDNCRDADSDEGWNGSMSGSAAVVAFVDGRWQTIAVANGVNAGECSMLRRADHRDTLICRSRYDAYSIGTDYYFFSLDFGGGTPMARTVAHVLDDVGNFNCGAREGQTPMAPSGITSVKSVSIMTRDINGDGTPDVVLDVERARVEPSALFEAKLRAVCKQGKPVDALLPAPAKHRIEILSDGSRFRPTPPAKAMLERWRKESPDVTQLEGAAPPNVDR